MALFYPSEDCTLVHSIIEHILSFGTVFVRRNGKKLVVFTWFFSQMQFFKAGIIKFGP